MICFIKKKWHHWKELLSDKKYRISLLAGFALLLIAYYLNYTATLYTSEIPVLSVGDLILDHIPTLDLSVMFTFGIYLVAAIVTIYPLVFKPELLPFAAKTVAAFIIIRSGFISMTHLGAPEGYFRLPGIEDQPGLTKFFYMNDLFFSGHTGFPFLAALLFWENKWLRWFMLAMSVGQSFTVLFMHVHYSIDVFSAYFITYTIYVVSDKIFNKLNLSFRLIVKAAELKMRQFTHRE
jgi:hypothetical protein